MIVELLLYCSLISFITGVLAPFATTNKKIVNFVAHGMAALGCLAVILCAIFVFYSGKVDFGVPLAMPFGLIHIRLDHLAAYFLLIIGVVGCAASIYAIGYSQEYYDDGRRYQIMAAFYNAFLLSMVLVVSVSHVMAFIVMWELMAITSFFLVNQEHEKAETRRAAFVYIVMTHVGTAFIIMAFLLLACRAGSLDFDSFVQTAGRLDIWTKNAVFICALIGFGAKAGIIPLHIWLPRAHPAAPSHVSALMSGVMIKTAIYGLCRFCFEFLGVGPVWWGALVLVLAVASSVLGVLYALMENDLKRLLAYSSVENIGIVLLGIGAGLIFTAKGQGGLAALAWGAALYHVFNHAIFKSLLFMGAGAVLKSAHTKNMEYLGGLIKKMPYTALCFLAGGAAISALPPLNGFVSEWLIFQALFFLPQALNGLSGKVISALLVALLGLTGAMAAACFVKAFGVAFLAKPRSIYAEQAKEVDLTMLVPMAILSGLCVFFGLWTEPVIYILKQVLASAVGVDTLQAFSVTSWSVTGAQVGTAYTNIQMPLIAALIVFGGAVAIAISRLYGKQQVVHGETWTCGIVPSAKMAYTATGFSKPIRIAFRAILRPQREVLVDTNPSRYFGRRLSYHVSFTDIFNEVYRPLNTSIIKAAQFMKAIQTGNVQQYIGYITAITVLALILITRW
ncbi:MAG: hyfB 2 [Sporomusa sp.]|jgi:hydrogenase-4 component B|nr:hyfB 2 [Sporomusa sp.]